MDNKKIGQFIASQRKLLSMTQQELADKMDITNKAVSKWETGEGYPDITLLPTLAEILEVTVDEILKGEKNLSDLGTNTFANENENTRQEEYISVKISEHIFNNYWSGIFTLSIGIIVSYLWWLTMFRLPYKSKSLLFVFEFYGCDQDSIKFFFGIIISLTVLIIDLIFYINIYKGFKSDITNNKRRFIYLKNALFFWLYFIQIIIILKFVINYSMVMGMFYLLLIYFCLFITGILIISILTTKLHKSKTINSKDI